jgi:hypothetical protein
VVPVMSRLKAAHHAQRRGVHRGRDRDRRGRGVSVHAASMEPLVRHVATISRYLAPPLPAPLGDRSNHGAARSGRERGHSCSIPAKSRLGMPVGAVLREPESLDSRSASNEFSHRSTPRVNCSSGSPGRMTGPPSTTSQRVTRDRVSRATRSSQSSTAYSSRPYRSETANWSPTHGSPRRSSAISCACGRYRSQPLRSQRDRSSACAESPQPGPHGSRKGPVDGTLLCRALDREGRLDRDGGTAVTAIEFGQSRRRCVLLSTPGTRPSARALLRPRAAGRVDGLQDTRP